MTKSVYANNELEASDKNSPWVKLFELIADGANVLDIGCSSGNLGKALIEQKRCRVVGIDINEDDLKIAATHLTKAVKKNIEQDDLSDLGVFDFVLMADVIEHVVDPVKALQKVRKLLVPGGKLVFSVPNMANIANRIELLGGRFEYTEYGMLDETHLHYYDRIELEKVFTQAGFKVELYNNTIRDVPERMVVSKLKELGLTPNDKFLKLASDIDSITFQFIGTAKPLSSKLMGQTAEAKSKTPHDFMSKQFDAQRLALGTEIESLKGQIEKQKQLVKQAVQEKTAVAKELHSIKSSKGWHVLTKVYGAKHQISKVIRRK